MVHERRRRRERPGQLRGELARALAAPGAPPGRCSAPCPAASRSGGHGRRMPSAPIRPWSAADRSRRNPGRPADRLQIHSARHQVGRGDTVGQRVVDLADHRDPAVGEAFDEVHLPQRPAAVQRGAGDLADRLVELTAAARAVHPVRAGRGSRGRPRSSPATSGGGTCTGMSIELVAERVELVEPAVDDLAELFHTELPVTEIVELDDRELECVHMHVRRLAVQQHSVPPAKPLHCTLLAGGVLYNLFGPIECRFR